MYITYDVKCLGKLTWIEISNINGLSTYLVFIRVIELSHCQKL